MHEQFQRIDLSSGQIWGIYSRVRFNPNEVDAAMQNIESLDHIVRTNAISFLTQVHNRLMAYCVGDVKHYADGAEIDDDEKQRIAQVARMISEKIPDLGVFAVK